MRIITQNIMMCNVNKCITKEIPLNLIVNKSEIIEQEFSKELIQKTLKRLDWENLVETAKGMGEHNLPVSLKEDILENGEFLLKMHNILYQFHVQEGLLVCKECKREYVIKNGIPNMLLEDDEIVKFTFLIEKDSKKLSEYKQNHLEKSKSKLNSLQIQKVEFLADKLFYLNDLEEIYFQKEMENNLINQQYNRNITKEEIIDEKSNEFLIQEKEDLRKFLLNEENQELLNLKQSTSVQANPQIQQEEKEEQTEFNIVITSFEDKSKLKIIKEIKQTLKIGLKDAKDKLNVVPFNLKEKVGKDESQTLKQKYEKLGCKVEIKQLILKQIIFLLPWRLRCFN